VGLAVPASAATPTDTTALQNAVTVGNGKSGIRQHLKQFQVIADANNGTRATGTSGHVASLSYVKSKLDATGYWTTSTQPFEAKVFTPLADPTLSVAPAPSPAWLANEDSEYIEFSANGSVTNTPIAVIDFVEPTQTASTSSAGCETSDFPAGGLGGKVAVIQRGTCDFGLKVVNAQNAGASAVIIFNEGTLGDPDRNGLISGTLGSYDVKVPVLGATYEAGRYLVDHPSATVSLTSTTKVETLQTNNLIAEAKTGRTDRTVISGAHLDSVPRAPASTTTARARRRSLRSRCRWQAQPQVHEPRALHLVRGRGAGPARLDLLRRPALEGAGLRHRGDAGLRHAGLPELRQADLRR
jgi:Zn-dependent M28 family amino/carboxypeptidase